MIGHSTSNGYLKGNGITPKLQYIEKYHHCGVYLQKSLKEAIKEIAACIKNVKWEEEFRFITEDGKKALHQSGYNKAFEKEFLSYGWEIQPLLLENPRLIGDYRKELVFVEVQFGNSATLYRDYYKFQYGLANGLLSLAVLIVPTNPKVFFPTRPSSVNNMAEFELADRYLTVLPIRVPTLLIGLVPQN